LVKQVMVSRDTVAGRCLGSRMLAVENENVGEGKGRERTSRVEKTRVGKLWGQ